MHHPTGEDHAAAASRLKAQRLATPWNDDVRLGALMVHQRDDPSVAALLPTSRENPDEHREPAALAHDALDDRLLGLMRILPDANASALLHLAALDRGIAQHGALLAVEERLDSGGVEL